jgi:membrane-bound lytic murein transglycosylase B
VSICVPAEIIVGIIGVETVYGQQMGSFRVIDALATLAFDFPASHPRAAARRSSFAVSWSSSCR